MSEHFGDERSIRVRGEMRAIEILLLDEITPFVTDDDLTETMSEIRGLLERKTILVPLLYQGLISFQDIIVQLVSYFNNFPLRRWIPCKRLILWT